MTNEQKPSQPTPPPPAPPREPSIKTTESDRFPPKPDPDTELRTTK